mmetsp:Transcript_23511/g.49734  ORF Transcript_23511/g.49734 Transcript_23511/m.49734 type:complete len:299 (+) Transcript_23511:885-1781(+)
MERLQSQLPNLPVPALHDPPGVQPNAPPGVQPNVPRDAPRNAPPNLPLLIFPLWLPLRTHPPLWIPILCRVNQPLRGPMELRQLRPRPRKAILPKGQRPDRMEQILRTHQLPGLTERLPGPLLDLMEILLSPPAYQSLAYLPKSQLLGPPYHEGHLRNRPWPKAILHEGPLLGQMEHRPLILPRRLMGIRYRAHPPENQRLVLPCLRGHPPNPLWQKAILRNDQLLGQLPDRMERRPHPGPLLDPPSRLDHPLDRLPEIPPLHPLYRRAHLPNLPLLKAKHALLHNGRHRGRMALRRR